MDILEKIRNQSETKKKVILWTTIIVIGLVLFLLYLKNTQNSIKNFKSIELKEKFRLPSLGEELKGWPKFEMPEVAEQELKKIEEEIKKIDEEKQSTTTE